MVTHEITLHLARAKRFDITYAYINSSPTEIPAEAGAEIAELREAGVRFLDPIIIDPQPIGSSSIGSRLSSLLHNRPDRLLTGTDRTAQLVEALSGKLPDMALTVWAETASNLVSGLPSGYRFTYAGNPDHKVLDARIELAECLGDVSLLGRLRNMLRKQVVKAAHLKVMRRFDLMWNVAANDAADYRLAGVNARYLQNMWPRSDHRGLGKRTRRPGADSASEDCRQRGQPLGHWKQLRAARLGHRNRARTQATARRGCL